MSWESPLLTLPFIILALVAMYLADEAWRRERSPGSMSFALLMLVVSVWLAAIAGRYSIDSPAFQMVWVKIAYFSIAWLATLWLTFCLEYAYRYSIVLARFGKLLWIMPLLSILIIFTNDLHHWFWRSITFIEHEGLLFERGFWFWIFTFYNYFLLAAGAIVLLRGLTRFVFYQRRQVAALLSGMLLPWLANIIFIAGWIPQDTPDVTPYVFSISGILYTWTLYRMRLFDPVPLARDFILDQMNEGYIAFDQQDRLLDMNHMARRLLGIGDKPVLGHPASEVLAPWPDIIGLLTSPDLEQVEIKVHEKADLYLEASLSSWSARGKQKAGKIIIFYDISRRKKAEIQREKEVLQGIELEERLGENLKQQTFVNDLLQMMFKPENIIASMEQALSITGNYLNLSRVYICQNNLEETESSILLEWCSEDILPRAREAPLIRYGSLPNWQRLIDLQGMIKFPESNFQPEEDIATEAIQPGIPEDLATYMDAWEIKALAVLPVYGSENRNFGFMAFDDCREVRYWSEDEVGLLWNVCKIISGAVSQMEVENARKRQGVLTEALRDTAKVLNSTLNSEEVLDRVLANFKAVVPTDAASIAMVDDDGTVRFVRWRGYDPAGDHQMRHNKIHISDRETYRWMSLTGETVIISDTLHDKRWEPDNGYSWIRSYAGAPIVVKGKVVGFLNLDSATAGYFTPDVADRLRVFADQTGIAIENANLYNIAQRRAEEMGMLYRIGLSLTANIKMDQVLTALFEQCRSILPVDVFYVLLYDAETDNLSHGIFYQEGEFQTIEPRHLSSQPGMTSVVIRERRTVVIQDTYQAETEGKFRLVRLGGKPARSYVAVPLIILDQVVGVISMQSFLPYAYSDEQVQLLETISTQAAIAVHNARLYEQMHQMAITDSVTQLYTRHHFTMIGHNEVERARRYNRALSVLMVDIDRFKNVNDSYGHYAGDKVLKAVARICSQVLRTTDHVGRWGGEEFTILLPEADVDGATLIAERIRRIVADHEIMLVDGRKVKVTVSLGVSSLMMGLDTLEALVDAADKAMYLAKQAGRNQVKVFPSHLS